MPGRAARATALSSGLVAAAASALIAALLAAGLAQAFAEDVAKTSRRALVTGSGTATRAHVPLLCPSSGPAGCAGKVTLRARLGSSNSPRTIGSRGYSLGWLRSTRLATPIGPAARRALAKRGALAVVARITGPGAAFIRRALVLVRDSGGGTPVEPSRCPDRPVPRG